MRTKDEQLLLRIQEAVKNYCDENGVGVKVRELANIVGISKSVAFDYITQLINDNKIVKGRNGYESVDFANTERAMCSVAILGAVPCGALTEVEEYIEGYVRLPESLIGRGKFFILTANGDSMINAGINNGDLVLIRKQEEADIGDIIVALVENEVTLKRLEYNDEERRYYLHPENERYDDIYVEQLVVQGVAVKIIKDIG